MLIHDIIKIKYVQHGYMKKNYPYHLISDEEMFNAFIDLGTGFESILIDNGVRFFDINYPNPFAKEDYIYQKTNSDGVVVSEVSLNEVYNNLKENIKYYILDYLKYCDTPDATKIDPITGELIHRVPDWVYTYMLGEVVYQQSDYLDIQDTLDLLGCYNIDNIFTRDACIACYVVSSNYISTLSNSSIIKQRVPTIFGEPHVIKSLRMNN